MTRQLGTFRFPVRSAAPGSPGAGEAYIDSGTGRLQIYSGAAWIDHGGSMRAITGSYRCGSTSVAGSVAIQNLVSIENPVASGKNVYVKHVDLQGVVAAAMVIKFQYRIGRTTGMPTVGTVLTAQKKLTAAPAPVAIVRQAPTAIAAAGDLWAGSPGVLTTAAGEFAPVQMMAFAEGRESDDIILVPGEGLLVRADANAVAFQHYADISWDEGTGTP